MNKLYHVKATLAVEVETVNLYKLAGETYYSERESPLVFEQLQDAFNFGAEKQLTIETKVDGYYYLPEWLLELDNDGLMALEDIGQDEFLAIVNDYVLSEPGIHFYSINKAPWAALVDVDLIEPAGEDVVLRLSGLADELFILNEHNQLRANKGILTEVPMKESKVDNSIHSIANELTGLREESDRLGMRAASLFARVKNEKLFKAEFGSFRAFCEYTTWHFTTVYSLIAIYENPALKEAYPVIGQLKAIKLSKSGLQGEALQDMIEYAKEHTAKELGEALKAGKPEAQPEQPKEESLEDKLERQSMLLARKAELEQELQEIMSELASLTKEVQLLAA
jgi:hypothetical protein